MMSKNLTVSKSNSIQMTRKGVLKKYPRLIAHMICESLGYFSADTAAAALLAYIKKEPFWCEWYCHMAHISGGDLLEVGKRVVLRSFQSRKSHRGYMAEYQQAWVLVQRELSGLRNNPFGGWF